MKRILSIILTLSMVLSMLVSPVRAEAAEVIHFAGKGSADNPYKISTMAELEALRSGSHYNEYIVLTDDITYTGSLIEETGQLNNCTIDGQGHTISGINSDGYPLFRCPSNSTIMNLNFEDCTVKNASLLAYTLYKCKLENVTCKNVTCQYTKINDRHESGGFVTALTDTEVTNVNLNMNMSFKGYGNVGILCAEGSGTIKDSVISGKIKGEVTYKKGYQFTWLSPFAGGSFVGDIEGCTNNMDITLSLPDKEVYVDLAGISAYYGEFEGFTEPHSIKNCVNNGNLTIKSSWNLTKTKKRQYNRIAGIVCQSIYGASIENCINNGDLKSSYGYGIAGIGNEIIGDIKNCLNTGNITSIACRCSAGICNKLNAGTIENCENKGSVTATEKLYYSTYAGGTVTAGILNEAYADEGNCYVKKCKNSGKIKVIDKSMWSTEIAGIVTSITANKKYHTEVTYCYNTGELTGTFIGGIVAACGPYDTSAVKDPCIIKNCLNAGKLHLTYNDDRVAGIVFISANIKVSYCYNTGSIVRDYKKYKTRLAQIASLNYKGSKISNCYIVKGGFGAVACNNGGGKGSKIYKKTKSQINALAKVKKIKKEAGIKD